MGVPRKITKDCTSLSVRGKKRFGKVYRRSKNEELLPKDVLVSIFARVASSSFEDLFNAKLSCTDFLEAANDEYIYKYVSMDKFPIFSWNRPSDQVLSFLARCFEKGNAEALFRHGMVEYFKQGNVESGLEFLKRASEKKHLEATYVYGMFLLSRGGDSSKQGLQLLNCMKSSRSGNWNVGDCRDKVESVLHNLVFFKKRGSLQEVYTKWRHMLVDNRGSLQKVYTNCRDQNHDHEFRDWDFHTGEILSSCDTCMWYRELVFFGRTMKKFYDD
ncbi:tetratricopeptide-like helical domain-containing protein [Artemisia annua]|uniref:Tetratricopeptide-like helical domain-containing protein n=1 Tax=Artemisia annua TaxID=35608 RepID=A0A2U1KA88_ARTAN|nr:tetratricopeptide-like helical domain-containing protein [Artemisia annua]